MDPESWTELEQLRDELRQRRTTPELKLGLHTLRITIILGIIPILLMLLQPSPEVGRFAALVVIELVIFVVVAGLLIRAINRSILRPQTVLLLIVVSLTSFPRDILRWHKDGWARLWSPGRQASTETTSVPATPTPDSIRVPQSVSTVVAVTVAAQVVLIVYTGQALFAPGQNNQVAPATMVVPEPSATQSVSVVAVLSPPPSCTPAPGVLNHAPSFLSPDEGQRLDFEGAYIFEVKPDPGSDGYLWGFEQNGQVIWDTLRDGGAVEGAKFAIYEDSPAHTQFRPGDVLVNVRAGSCGEWSEAATRSIVLVSRTDPSPTAMPTPDCRITETCP